MVLLRLETSRAPGKSSAVLGVLGVSALKAFPFGCGFALCWKPALQKAGPGFLPAPLEFFLVGSARSADRTPQRGIRTNY
jgi:hypothetical protein